MRRTRIAVLLAAALTSASACSDDDVSTSATPTSQATTIESTTSTESSGPAQDITALDGPGPGEDLEPGTYSIDPDADPSTPMRVEFELPEGWKAWVGAFKDDDPDVEIVNITTVPNLVGNGCTDRDPAAPAVGPAVDDLVTALTALPPFEVTGPPVDATFAGYEGTHLEWAVPDEGLCPDGELHSWFSPLNDHGEIAFRGYDDTHVEEFWILDVDGERLMVSAMSSPDSDEDDLAELQGVVDSIRVVP